MSRKLVVGAISVVLGVALATACGSSNNNSGSNGNSGGAGGSATGGSAGSSGAGGSGGSDAGTSGGSGGTLPYQDADLDAPYQLPDGGCGQIFCPAAVNAACSKSFQSLNDCATFCNQVAQSQCAQQWNAVLVCAGPNPQLTCDTSGNLSFSGCDSEQKAFVACAFPDGG